MMARIPRILITRLARFGLLVLLSALVIAGAAWLIYQANYSGRIFRGVSINGVSVSGMTAQEALAAVQFDLSASTLPHLELKAGDRTWLMSANSLGAVYRLEPAVAEALALGRSGNFRNDLGTQIKLLVYGYTIQPEVRFDASKLQVLIRELASETARPSRGAQLVVQGFDILSEQEQAGQEIDATATQLAIQQAFLTAQDKVGWGQQLRLRFFGVNSVQAQADTDAEVVSVALVMRNITPRISDYQLAAEQARILLSSPITLEASLEQINQAGESSYVKQSWVIDQALLASWLVVKHDISAQSETAQVSLDEAKMVAYLQTLNTQLSRPSFEGSYRFNPDTQALTILKPAQVGYSLDIAAALELLRSTCFSQERTVELPLRSVQPTVHFKELQALLPLQLISSGETQFRGSSAERFQNIRRAAEQFQFVLVPPKASFSFLAVLGAVTIANGYSESWIIYGNKTVLGPGGGVCQVATTLFRAVFFGGFPVVERTPHSYRISRYEPPVGLDAAVFSPSTDFKFTNDMDTPIIITNKIDEASGVITFYIYGAPANRTVRIEDAVTSNPKPAGTPIYEVDPKLAPGESILVEEAHDGIDASLTRVIEQNGQVINREQFFSRYSPWPARYRVGPS
ncbi:MAG: VanW family protein [Anaerolineae bacterium]